jgi:voltage-gated potassium channel
MPDAVGGMHMAQLITKPEVIEFLNMLTGVSGEHLKLEDIHFDELRADYQSKSIRQLNIRQLTEATVIGYKSLEKGFIFNPSADLIIKKGDTMIILGNETSIEKFKQTYCKESSISL